MRRLFVAIVAGCLSSGAAAQDVIVRLTEPEARVAIQMLDAAVKAHGMQAAEAGIVLSRKIGEAIAAYEKEKASKPDPKGKKR